MLVPLVFLILPVTIVFAIFPGDFVLQLGLLMPADPHAHPRTPPMKGTSMRNLAAATPAATSAATCRAGC